jgi:hypothetical protein
MSTLENYIKGNLLELSHEKGVPIKCGTFYNFQVHRHWDQLNSELQALYVKKIEQTKQKEKSMLTPGGHFMLHWDESNASIHAVPLEDIGGNGIPDYIDSAAVILDHVWEVEINRLGYDIPPQSNGQPVTVYYVYFSDLSYMYGQTVFEFRTKINDLRTVYSSYMELENDYSEGFYSPGLAGLKVTAAHEFHHAIQVGYNYQEQQLYFYEMTAVWMEDVVYPEVNDYFQYLPSFFHEVSNLPFDLFNGVYPYANSIYLHMIVKKYGRELVHAIWENFKSKIDFIDIMADIMYQRGSSWLESLNEYGVWIYNTGIRADTVKYFPEGDLYPQIQIEEKDIITLNDQISIQRYSNYYVKLYGIKHLQLQFTDQGSSGQVSAGFRILYPDNDPEFYPIQSLINSDHDTLNLVITNSGNMMNTFKLDYDTGDIYPYPNPVIADQDYQLRFLNVPEDANIYIYTISGRKVITLKSDYHSKIRIWDLKNHQGEPVPSGVYIFLIQSNSMNKVGKFSIIR